MNEFTFRHWVSFLTFCVLLIPSIGLSQTCGTTINTYPYSESYESGLGAWTQDTGDNTDWTRNSGGTTSSTTGPSGASSGSYYLYTEATSNYNNTTNIESPCFDLTGITTPQFNFDYHMYGANMGTLNVDISVDNGVTYPTNLWTQTGQVQTSNGQAWNTVTLDLSPYVGQTIKIRFQGLIGNGYRSDMAVDNVSIVDTGAPVTCGTTINTFPYSEDYETGFGVWTQNLTDNFDWTRRTGGTPSSNTGPSGAGSGSYYIYTEGSNNNNNTGILESPCFDLTGTAAPQFAFSYHMYGANMGTLNVDISVDNGVTYPTNLWTQTGQVQTSNGQAWITVTLDLSPYVGQIVMLRFEGITGNGYRSDMAVDNVSLVDLVPSTEIDVTGLGVSINDNDATPSTLDDTDWGNVNVGFPTVHTFTINNTGSLNLNLTGLAPYIVLGGANAADFSVTATPSNSIAASGSTTFNITFNPSAVGLRTATLTIANDDSNENPYNFDIQGTGTTPSYCISNGSTTYNTGTTNVTFNTINNSDGNNLDNAYEDFTGISTTVIQSNAYNLSVSVDTGGNYTAHTWAWIDWNQDYDFNDAGEAYDLGEARNVTNGTTSLSPLSITIPSTATLGTTRMRVSTKYDANPTNCETGYDGEVEDYSINVIPNTPQPEMDVTGLGISIADNDVTPSTLDETDWGNVNVGFPTIHTFTINNTGTLNLNLTGLVPYIIVGGLNPAEFVVSAAPAPIIGPVGSTTFNITFTPAGIGVRSATLSIANTDANENPYNFTIQGTGFTPSPEIDITGLGLSIVSGDVTPAITDDTDFGTTDLGAPVAHTFTIDNSGTLNLTVGTVTIAGANPGDFSLTTAPAATVTPSGNTTFVISFNPTTAGLRTATVSVANNDTDENPYTYSIQGQGTYPPPQYTYYFEDFDASNGGWNIITSTNDTWSWTSTYPISVTDGLAEGGIWRSNNFNNYVNNTTIVIQSPTLDFTGLQNLQLSLDVEYDTENNTDGMRVLYSVAGGAYTLLGASGQGTNWYDDNTSTLGSDGWNNDSHPTLPVFPGRYSHFKNAILPLSDATFAGQNTVRFRIEFRSNGSSTDDGVAFDNFRIEGDPVTPLNDASVAPANITSDLRLWLKMNAGVSVSDGAALTSWLDQAYDTGLDRENAQASSSLAPTYRDNTSRNINYNPVADFDNTSTEYMNGKGGFFSQDYFVVVKSDDVVDTQTGAFSPGRQFAIGARSDEANYHEDPTGVSFGNATGRYVNEVIAHNMGAYANSSSIPGVDSYGRAFTSATETFDHVMIVNVKANAGRTAKEIYKNGKRIDNTTGTTGATGTGTLLNYYEFDNLSFLIGTGRSGLNGRTTSQLNGMLGEVVSYKNPNSVLNQQKIQSYLGVKYGVTLQDAATALSDYRVNDVDYIDSNGSVFWDTSANSAYNYDIAGIGRDDNSQLDQKQSMSQNLETDVSGPTSGFLTMGLTQIYNTNNENISTNPTTVNDREFLMWGNNNASLDGTAITVTVDMSQDLGDGSLVTNVNFTAIPRIWKVVEIGGDIPSVEVSIPTSIVRTATPPDGRYLMFISATGIFDPTADYRVMTETGGNLYTDYDFDGTEYITFGWAPEIVVERSVFFEPSNSDYIDIEDNLDLAPAGFTISSWIKPEANDGTILSKRPVSFTEGFDFKVHTNDRLLVRWINGGTQQLQSSVDIPMNEWHHVAVVYNGTRATIFIDGVADTSANLSPPSNTAQSFFIGAYGKTAPTNFFEGNIDEVRVWDTALSPTQLRYIMNQEIEDNSNFVGGKYFEDRSIIPTKEDVATIPWSNLAGYYPMSTYTYTNTKDESGNGHQGALKNLKTVDWQTAPLPYMTTQNGDWDNNNSWLNGNVQTIPGTTSIVNSNVSVDWNIVTTNHDIIINDDSDLPAGNASNRSVLALFVDSNELVVDGDNSLGTGFGLTVTHYLNLDGNIDLDGESQLIQSTDSDLEVSSSGILEKDQQGVRDLYTYNYWSAPVGFSNTISNNNSYALPDVLRNGTNPAAPNAITFLSSGYDGNITGSDISIADYWIWKYANQLDDNYSAWQHIRSTGSLNVGEGYTMKGVTDMSGNPVPEQNYTFIGKPNNGAINLPLSAGNDYLVGNPYPSAIDADQFILDNGALINGAGATTGTLYFWEHWGGGSHNLSDYLGGYGTYNLSGGTPSAALGTNDPDVGTGGTPTKTPGRYIPVGQGFFVVGETTGTINFNNGQRIFQREGVNSVFMDANPNGSQNFVQGRSSESQADLASDQRTKIRIGFNSINTMRRQLLLTVDENATEGHDWGYDARLYEIQMDDLYWIIENEKHTIQGIGSIETETVLPLGVHIDGEGMNSIVLDEVNNAPDGFEIYVHDNELDIYHDLQAGPYEFYLISGEDLERFEITFSPDALGIEENELNALDVHYSNDMESIILINPIMKEIKSIEMLNVLGQTIYSVATNSNIDYAEYKVSNLSTGTYVLQINTQNGIISKKVLVE